MMRSLLGFVVSVFCCCPCIADTYNVFTENGKVGLKDQQGHIVIPASYEALGWSDGTFSVINRVTGYKSNGMWGLVDLDNQPVMKATLHGLIPGQGNVLVAVKKSDLSYRFVTGCIDSSGKEVIPFIYDDIRITAFRAIVTIKSGTKYKCGLSDLSNKILIPAEYMAIEHIGAMRYAVQNAQHRYALFTENGKQLTPFSFDYINPFKKDYAIVSYEGNQGIIDREGLPRADAIYSLITIDSKGTIKVKPPDKWTIFDGQSNTLAQLEADSIVPLNDNLFKLQKGVTVQLVNAQFNPVTPVSFSSLSPFINHKAIFSRGLKRGIINNNGTIVAESIYDALWLEKDYSIGINGKHYILLDSAGNQKTTKSYNHIGDFNSVLFPVKSRQHYGAIDKHGKEIISCVYDSLLQVQDGMVVVKFHNAYGVIDLRENWIIAPQPYPLLLLSNDRYLVTQGPTTFLKSLDGSTIYFTDNKLEIKGGRLLEHTSSGSLWEISMEGRIVSRTMHADRSFEKIFPESEGLRGILKDGRYGFIDEQARLRIANRYEDIQPFCEGMAAIKILNRWGFIDRAEKLVIQPVFDAVTSFQNGIAIVQQKGLFGLIDKTGKPALPPRYDSILLLPTKRYLLKADGLTGLADSDGKLIVVPKFNQLTDLGNGYLVIERDGQYGLMTTQGLSTIPMMYDYLSYDRHNQRYFALKRSEWTDIVATDGSN